MTTTRERLATTIRRRFAITALVVGAFVAGLLGFAVKGAAPMVTLESQAWWAKTGISIPGSVGAHIHVRATVPADGTPTAGKVDVPVTVIEHNSAGSITQLRVSNGSTVMQTWPIALGPCADCTWSGTVTVDFGRWPTGRDEMRWTANIPSNADGLRQFQSTGWEICVRSCSPSYRAGPWVEARGWYSGRGYANARLTSDLAAVRSGATITVSLKPGSGGLPTKLAGAYIDPDFHHGSAGIVVSQWSAAFTGSITLPVLPTGPHKLVLLSSDGLNAGVLAIPFDVP